tara:strand:- start:41 stop:523 length:483 start_codon:yes stop_codon:yes gene_type:complete
MSSSSNDNYIEIAGEGVVPVSDYNKVIIERNEALLQRDSAMEIRDSTLEICGRLKDICEEKKQEVYEGEIAIKELKKYCTLEMIENRDNNIANKKRENELMTTCMTAMKKMKEELEKEKNDFEEERKAFREEAAYYRGMYFITKKEKNELQKIYDNLIVD